jgi:GGDEF domain-containing protein
MLFYIFERFIEPLSFIPVPFGVVILIVLLLLSSHRFSRFPSWIFPTISVVVILIAKFWTGWPSGIGDVFVRIAEVIATVISVLLAYWTSGAINEFERTVDNITIGRLDRLYERGMDGESILYREVRRARNHGRPLSMMAVSVEEGSVGVALDRIIKETQIAMARHYALAGVSKVLCNSLEDSDVIVQRNDHFLIVLPETIPDSIPRLIERLRRKIRDDVGVQIKVGTAVLSKDGMTFEGLIEKATQEMIADQYPCQTIRIGQVSDQSNIGQ